MTDDGEQRAPRRVNLLFAASLHVWRMAEERRVDWEMRLRLAVARAYALAGVEISEPHLESLGRVYAHWAQDPDERLVERLERALARSLGAATH